MKKKCVRYMKKEDVYSTILILIEVLVLLISVIGICTEEYPIASGTILAILFIIAIFIICVLIKRKCKNSFKKKNR